MKDSFSGKTIALIAYAPFVGFLIAFFINKDVEDKYATWHIKNMFGISLMFIVSLVIQSQIDVLIGDVLWLCCLIVWIYSWVMAFQNKKKAIPVLSEKFQEWFSFLD